MDRQNQIPRLIFGIGLIVVLAVGYDLLRPYINKEKPLPWQSPVVAEAPDIKRPTVVKPEIPKTNRVPTEALPTALSKGKWGVIVYWPNPQDQTIYTDAVIADIKAEGGILHPLATCQKYYDVIAGVNDEDIATPILPGKPKGVAEGAGAICIWDLKNEGKPRLVYNQTFPYYGISGEYVSEGWSSSEVLTREIVVTLQRWNEQSSHTNH